MRNISKEELNKILKEHELWLRGEGGKCADLSNVDLSYANLTYVNLEGADLENANLSSTNLKRANLRCVDLEYANLRCANLENANLEDSNLTNADLRYADLRYADLRCVDLKYADLRDVKTNIHTIGYNLACPEKGSFVGYKKAGEYLIELLILEDAKRSSAPTTKCRCNKAKVLDIENIKTGEKVNNVHSDYDDDFIYKVGEIVTVSNFDDDRWNECSTGIHFFMNKDNALNY